MTRSDIAYPRMRIAHAVPGRVRLVYDDKPGSARQAETLRRVAAALPGVRVARVSVHARSLVLNYDRNHTDSAWLLSTLKTRRAAAASPADGGPASLRLNPVATDSLRTARRVLAIGASVFLGAGFLPRALQFATTFGASLPLLREAASDGFSVGITSRVLEGTAIAISLVRGDYMVANTTNLLLALGEYISQTTAHRSDHLLRNLLRPASDRVWLLVEGREVEVEADQVKIGDTVVVAAGAVVPVDGTVLSGEASVNEAAMTGESAPVAKTRGGSVLSGTSVQEGRIAIYAERVGQETVTARIADYVGQSLSIKGNTQVESARLADRLVPSILSVACLSFLASGNWHRPASVLQADYSCALKLSTPIAFKFAMYGAGQSGILVKSARSLENLVECDTFVFDKTGTLTTGLLEVTDVLTFDDEFSSEDLIWLAASVEEHYSYHPVAMAIVAAARSTSGERHFDHNEVEFIVAHGVASVVDGKRIVIGSRHFLETDEGIDFSHHDRAIGGLMAEGKTVLFIGLGGRLLGLVGLNDAVRPGSLSVTRQLRSLGVKRLLLLTGDTGSRAADMARELELDGFFAELLPEDKARIVDEMTAAGARVAFVGDGINDGPALARSHVGIAMQRGADIARLTADVVLLEDDLEHVVRAMVIARDVMRAVSASYRLTIGLNTAIISGAAFGALSPLSTSILHNGTTVAILGNVLRRNFAPRRGGTSDRRPFSIE